MRPFLALVARDLKLAFREGSALGNALGFYLIVVTLLPLGLGPDLNLLARIAPGILWIAVLLASLLSLPRMLESDFEDGSLEILSTGALPLELATLAKGLAHWIANALPLVILTPVAGLLLNLEIRILPALLATMLLGTPAVSFLGAIGAALTLRSRRGALLVALLVLPLYLPTLIFGISAVSAASLGTDGFWPSLLILSAVSLVSLVVGPVAAAAAVKKQLG